MAIRQRIASCGRICAESEGPAGEEKGRFQTCDDTTRWTFVLRIPHTLDNYAIPTDEDYLSFIASLQNPLTKPVEVDVDVLCKLD